MKKVATKMTKTLIFSAILVCLIVGFTPQKAYAGDFELGMKAYQAKNYELAIRFFRQAAKDNRNNPNIHYYLADSLVKLKRYREAQVEYQNILALAPNSQAARFSRVALGELRHLEAYRYRLRVGPITTTRVEAKRADKFEGLTVNPGEDYLDEITDNGRLIRWSTLKMPLKLYVQSSPVGVRNFQPTFVNSMKKALDIWSRALDNRLTYIVVDSPEEADIRVSWVNSLDTRGQTSEAGTTFHAGITVPTIKNDQLHHMEIKMATFDITNKPQSGDNIFAIAIHEMGHALGLLGHSEDIKDIMYAQNQLVYVLSPRDKNTIRKLYANLADVTSLPAPKELDPEREKELAERLDEQILKEERNSREKGDSLSYLNLGTTYFSKGKAVNKVAKKTKDPTEKQKLQQEAQEWFDKAIEAVTYAIKLEPQSSLSYYNRCIIYQEFEEVEVALNDINMALKYDKNNAKYFREKAWILAKLKRKTEALNALEAYLIREPSGKNSEEVARIRKVISTL